MCTNWLISLSHNAMVGMHLLKAYVIMQVHVGLSGYMQYASKRCWNMIAIMA